MWNQIQTDQYDGMIAETICIEGYDGNKIHAYYSRPLGGGPFPGLVLIPHMPGWDEWCRETARRFTQHGYAVLCPNIYERVGHGTPDEVAGKNRAQGGLPDESVMGDTHGSADYLRSQPFANGKIGVIGMCSGGRHAFMAACRLNDFDAAVDCWGGGIFQEKTSLDGQTYTAADDCQNLSCPLLGLFGNEDQNPTPEDVNRLEELLKEYGKEYEFHRYDGAGHGFWYYHNKMYRQEQAMDSLEKTFAFFSKYLQNT